MSKDIKEIKIILKILKKCEWSPCLTKHDAEVLLDYITNLQEYYNDNANKYEELLVKYSELQEENQRLNENNQTMQEEMTRTWKIADDYKSKIYKARKMIYDNYGVLDKYEIELLDDILKGKDNE